MEVGSLITTCESDQSVSALLICGINDGHTGHCSTTKGTDGLWITATPAACEETKESSLRGAEKQKPRSSLRCSEVHSNMHSIYYVPSLMSPPKW